MTIAILLLAAPAFGQSLADEPDIKRAIEKLRENNTETVKKSVFESKVVVERRVVRSGIFGLRCRVVECRRTITVPKIVEERISGLEDGEGWDESSSTVGTTVPIRFKIPGIPKAAGGRATRINSILSGLLPVMPVGIEDVDRTLVANTKEFTTEKLDKLPKQISNRQYTLRLLARVLSLKDDAGEVQVLIQIKQANGELLTDKTTLNAIAAEYSKSLAAEIEK